MLQSVSARRWTRAEIGLENELAQHLDIARPERVSPCAPGLLDAPSKSASVRSIRAIELTFVDRRCILSRMVVALFNRGRDAGAFGATSHVVDQRRIGIVGEGTGAGPVGQSCEDG